MNDNTLEEEKSERVETYLNNLEDFEELYEQLILSEAVEEEFKHRRMLRSRAQKLLEEYEEMSEEEQEEFEERRNKEGRYTKEQLEEMADKDDDELMPEDKLEELGVPSRYAGGDMKARDVSEIREIMTTLMNNYDPVLKEAPNWSKSKRELEEKDIDIGHSKLKRYWNAIEEKQAFDLVKRKIYWQIMDKLEGAANSLVEHVVNRVESEGGDYDYIDQRVEALEKVVEMMKNMPKDEPTKIQKDEHVTKQEIRFSEMEEANRGDEEETIDVTEE